MIKLMTLATLLSVTTANASLVAVMDTGTDISHKDLARKAWVNKKEVAGSTTDLDGSGLPGDINGWDFTENSATVFNNKYNYLLTDDVKKFYSLYAKYETKTISSTEFEWLKSVVADQAFMDQVNFIGTYSHGTHCGGISLLSNPKARVMSLKIIPTVYQEEVAPENKEPQQLEFDFAPGISVEEFKQEVIKTAISQVEEAIPMNGYLNFHKVDVVNQSFGIGFLQAAGFIKAGFIEAVKREPSGEELVDLIRAYFLTLRKVGPEMFKAAPNTLFVIASGNDSSDNDALPDYPADIQAPNKIVVAATLGHSELAEFSNYGATKVDVAAPGVAIESTGPAQSYLHMSGTSQAAPYVTNAIANAKDINPALSAADIKKIIFNTVDVKAWLKDKVATSGIVNKDRVKRAAQLSKTMNVDMAIKKANTDISDVATPKSFARRLPGMRLNFKPVRPSLLVKIDPSL